MFDRLLAALGRGGHEAAEDHLDRNRLQEGKLPEHMPLIHEDPNAPHCLVDSNNTTWVADSPSFYAINHVMNFHPGEIDSWRGVPATSADAVHPDDARSPLSEPGPGIGYQAVYDRHTGELSPSSTADFASPQYSVADHLERDVIPDVAIGSDYHHYALSSGENLQDATRDSSPANIWPCEHGSYVGGDAFKGLAPPDPWHDPPAEHSIQDRQSCTAADHPAVSDWTADLHATTDSATACSIDDHWGDSTASATHDWGDHSDSFAAGDASDTGSSAGFDSGAGAGAGDHSGDGGDSGASDYSGDSGCSDSGGGDSGDCDGGL